ncbi:MAG: hypothetical protein AAB545_01820 [Patescibacteria group bacterium]
MNENNNVVDLSGQMGTPPAPQKDGAGAVVGAIIVILVIVLGALYFWGKEFNKQTGVTLPVTDTIQDEAQNAEALILNATDTATEALKNQGTSDAAKDIEADLKATDLNSVGDTGNIKAELGI